MHIQEININNRVYNYYFDNLVKAKMLETENILINEKNYKDLVIYFTTYYHSEFIKMLRLRYHELMGTIEEHEGKKYLMVDDSMLDKVSDRVKEIIDIEEFDNTKILINKDDKFPDNITLKYVVILITCVMKDDSKFYPQLFLEDVLFLK